MLDALIWPAAAVVCAVILGVVGMFVFRQPLTRLIDRASKAGKDGVVFDRPQSEGNPLPTLSFEQLMKFPVSATVLAREVRVKQQMASFDLKKDDEKIAVLIRAASLSRIEMEYNNISNMIFGSQVGLLVQLAGTAGGVPRTQAEAVFVQAQKAFPDLHGNRKFEEWIRYPISHELLTIQNDVVDITQYGKDFLKYLIDARLAYQRHG